MVQNSTERLMVVHKILGGIERLGKEMEDWMELLE